jgi:hypothetical protein
MMTNLSWSALILAALAAVACWKPDEESVCDVSRPVFGARVCCEKHRLPGGLAAPFEAAEAARRTRLGPPSPPRTPGDPARDLGGGSS